MSVIVNDAGFSSDGWTGPFIPVSHLSACPPDVAVDLKPEDDPAKLLGCLDHVAMIRINFPSFADGRGFTIARRLRLMGYKGRLRAKGHVIADQYAMARRSGFDEVEISEELADRQPQDHWLARAGWRRHDYQARLRIRA